MATELAKAYVQIIPSAQGISGKIQQAIEPEAEVAGTSFGGKLVSTIKNVIATAAIGKALVSTINEGAAIEQSMGGIETLFQRKRCIKTLSMRIKQQDYLQMPIWSSRPRLRHLC